jgi:hypothetical protein
MNGYTTGWIGWILYFIIEEGMALKTRTPNASFSAHVWQWFMVGGFNRPGPMPKARHAVLLMSMAWLLVHFATGGKY